ncbi:putative mandelate racemase/muconate lactonizing enzyme [Actinacidiphila reveromycinica]|uniref:Putative mandelate racemase/muconate lactonizing enzyme n=1 Tax=Actinacidiphila reveromycinica TaxID=659352 RepID=A0A7U3V0Q2_9ACTN|nr:enolase C-terminal domain-like protein [Streptomyces sp. SN-593]BBB02172.1 putative mandelate racemase/muconate lactonizing enzyme [Streptomyces sp. SN-593]
MTGSGPDRLLDASGALPEAAPPWQGRDRLRVTSVRAIVTAPEGLPLVVVRVDTSDPGLYGLGCATFTQRYAAVAAAVDEHVGPLVVGRHPADIEDITRMIHYSSYWRGGPVLGNALSGVDQALWDIAGKRAGMPVYELLGGRSRSAVEVYSHAAGGTVDETLAQAEELLSQGYRHVRLQVGGPGLGTYGAPGTRGGYPRSPHPDGWDVAQYLRATPALFAAARQRLGDEVSLMHDVHSRLTPKQAVVLARELEPYRLSFLEDVIAPEHYDRLPEVRAASPVPIAVGEQIGNVTDAARLIRDGGIDLLRLHTSAVGGLTPTRKLVALAELLGVRTAFHSPGDISPVGVAANLAVDISTPAFGYQESHTYDDATHEVFPGTPVVREGHLAPSDAPGWGVDLDEAAARRFPPVKFLHERWATGVRHPDGGLDAP